MTTRRERGLSFLYRAALRLARGNDAVGVSVVDVSAAPS